MAKARSVVARTRTRELEPYGRRRVDDLKFKPDLPPSFWADAVARIGDLSQFPFYSLVLETLGPTRTVGKGRTNLTVIRSTILQADAATPYIGFDRRESPSRNPAIQMHFEPGAYGMTAPATYVITFAIETTGQATFNLQGFAGAGTVANAGAKTVNGQTTLSLVLRQVPPSQVVYGYIEQTAGGAWNCYSVRARYPSLVFTQ